MDVDDVEEGDKGREQIEVDGCAYSSKEFDKKMRRFLRQNVVNC